MPLLVANWKMHGTRAMALDYAFAVNAALEMAPASIECIFCPPFPYLAAAHSGLPQNARLELGAQDCAAGQEGAFTGAVSARMLADVGCSHVILGHSERRAMGETDAQVAAKAEAALEAGLTPILCVGETEAENAKGLTVQVLEKQLGFFKKLPAGRRMVAYEPVWAIGSGKTPKAEEIAAAHKQVKTALGSATPVLYGGSVKPSNLREILRVSGVDGVLIGGASRDSAEMKTMIELAGQTGKGQG